MRSEVLRPQNREKKAEMKRRKERKKEKEARRLPQWTRRQRREEGSSSSNSLTSDPGVKLRSSPPRGSEGLGHPGGVLTSESSEFCCGNWVSAGISSVKPDRLQPPPPPPERRNFDSYLSTLQGSRSV
ncbi:hypothetical protein EYF80_048121 [Liparis tanakae]|uniref:Uncharacterized protein n=1 Tax=Liparis tanakae TaxID=230148 RepID=A0A4Z2FKE3_9TELE|nr:hypothetical protein EYF80_048121 [Liparis tanakae]